MKRPVNKHLYDFYEAGLKNKQTKFLHSHMEKQNQRDTSTDKIILDVDKCTKKTKCGR